MENDISARISYINGKQPNLIREQLRIALGDRVGFSQDAIKFKGSSIELRIVAEDTRRGFAPWIGTIEKFKFPEHEWAAVYTHVPFDRPYMIPSDFDPNLALVVLWGDSIQETKERASRFLSETVIEGQNSKNEPIVTNMEYLHNNLDRLLTF